MNKYMEKFKKKSIAISSGKGGVGKTTTAVNLGLYYARKGYKIGLIDLDPLSDIEILLDLAESEKIILEKGFNTAGKTLDPYVKQVFHGFHLLFPTSKLMKQDIKILRKKLFQDFAKQITDQYDLLIFDMPAGIRDEDNLSFLPFMGSLIIVTNSEPTAHVSAGGYIKALLDYTPELPIYIWHNKYIRNPGANFNPEDVIGNYNRNSPKPARIHPNKISHIEHLAFIPSDPTLDLLRANPSVTLNILRSMLDMVEFIKEEQLKAFAIKSKIPEKTFDLIKYFLIHRSDKDSFDLFIDDLGEYVGNIIRYRMSKDNYYTNIKGTIPEGRKIFTLVQIQSLKTLFNHINTDPLRIRALRIIQLLEAAIGKQENAKRLFFVGNVSPANKRVDLEISKLLISLNNQASHLQKTVKNTAGLLLFYFSLYKLFHSETMLKLLNNFIPVRKTVRGTMVRDKYKQIQNLVEENKIYKRGYLKLIKTLYPVITKQLSTMVQTFRLEHLYYRKPDNTINKEAYVKLFSHFMHDTVNSGLGIISGFKYRPASIAFHEAADKLIRKIKDTQEPANQQAAS
ncbi:MAG: AAA family ATPase [Spirochaetales bacterium]|nr:AAA family ATPase [Spirochaetales bacterium]